MDEALVTMHGKPVLTAGEVACRCGCGFALVKPELLDAFRVIREAAGRPLVVASGCRCEAHNAAVGGSLPSSHVLGEALDLEVGSSGQAYQLVALAIAAGVKRIGVGWRPGHHVFHMDVSHEPPFLYPGERSRLWTY